MDAYSSLLNLNFMASLRTGNVVADMLIAMLIPFVTGIIDRFFREWWPQLITAIVHAFDARDVETVVPAHRDARGSSQSADLDENSFLQAMLMNYVGTKVKPTYQYGSYQYKRHMSSGSGAMKKNPTLVETLRSLYVMQTVPTKEREVELNPSVLLRIAENADDAENAENGGSGNAGGGGGGGGGGDNDKKNKLKQKTTTMIFRTHQSYFAQEDAVFKFATDAVEYFKKDSKARSNTDRYLYQPLMSSGAKAAGGSSSGGGREAPCCQRYQLSREKTFATLFFPEKEKLIRLIHQFENKLGKFAIPGFPRKLVLLLYGPPGTGKTSLVKAIAELTRRHIFSIPLSRVQTNRQLLDYMFDTAFRIKNAPRQRYSSNDYVEKLQSDRVVYMLEDVDAASDIVKRKDGVPADSPTAEVAIAPATTKATKKQKLARSSAAATPAAAADATTEPAAKESKGAADTDSDEASDDEEEESTAVAAAAAASGEKAKKKPILIREDDNSSDEDENAEPEKVEDDDAAKDANTTRSSSSGSAPDAASDKDATSTAPEKKKDKKRKKNKNKDPTVDRVTIAEDTNSPFGATKDKLSIKGLLEAFGGILDAPGRIVIMTTNHIEHLDPVLLRPGVVTMKLHMGNFDASCGMEMVRHYFASQYASGTTADEPTEDDERTKPQWDEKLLAEVAAVITEAKNTAGGFSPAEVEQMCAENGTVEELLLALKRGSRREIF